MSPSLFNGTGSINLQALDVPPRAPIAVGPGISLGDIIPRPRYVRFCAGAFGGPLASIDLYMTGEAYMLPDGYSGGWSTIERKGNVDATIWTSGKPLAQAFPVILDRLFGEGSVEAEWNALERMCRPPNGERPPVLKIVGPALHTDRRWVIDGLDVDEDSFVREGGVLKRVGPFTITLRQHVTADVKTASTSKAKANGTDTAKAKAGEDYYAFSRRVLGSRRYAKKVATRNGDTDPHKKLKAGKTYRLPTTTTATKGKSTTSFEL